MERVLSSYHLESKESIEASLVIEPDDSADDEAPTAPSFCLAEPSPICVGFHEESESCSPSPEWI